MHLSRPICRCNSLACEVSVRYVREQDVQGRSMAYDLAALMKAFRRERRGERQLKQ